MYRTEESAKPFTKMGMKAIHITEWCGVDTVPETIVFGDVPDLNPPVKNEVIIKLKASAINIDDIALLQDTAGGGWFFHARKPSVSAPLVGGCEYAGVVLACGPDCTRLKVGDRVCGINETVFKKQPGTWAEKTMSLEEDIVSIPEDLDISFVDAASLCMGAFVSGVMYKQAKFSTSDAGGGVQDLRVLVFGASGGLGTIMLQLLASHKPAPPHITAICSGKNVNMVRELGADEVVDYSKGPIATQLQLADTEQFDVVFDLVGGVETEESASSVLRKGGKFITGVGPIRYLGERQITFYEWMVGFAFGLTWRMLKGSMPWAKHSYELRAVPPPLKAEDFERVAVQAGVRGKIALEVPFKENPLREALRLVGSRSAGGKVVINFET